MSALKEFQTNLSAAIREHKTPPAPDPFDPERYPFGKQPGANKLDLMVCATCGKPPTLTGRNDCPEAFMFRDRLSAREYYVSGMCQQCQDEVFRTEDEFHCVL